MNTLDFLNKNMYRKYPLQDTCDMLFEDGTKLPQGIITSIQLSTKYGYHSISLHKVSISENYVSVSLYCNSAPIGCFAGVVTSDFATIPFISGSDYSFISGSLTIGRKETLTECLGTHVFGAGAAMIEDSVIFCFTPPPVKSISHDGKRTTGRITTSVGSSLTQTLTDNIDLSVRNVANITSNNEYSGTIADCPTPIITKINTVSPDENGNIDIYGIVPVVINVETGELEFLNPLTLPDVCPEKNKISPPVNNSDDYYGDILELGITEWRTWDRFA